MNCDRIRPLLARAAEGESTPDEAIDLARHLDRCTACRIRLARERHLQRLLECDLEDFPVDDSFVDDVMQHVPVEPPPRKRRDRRGLKLASLAGLIGMTGWGASTSLPALGALGGLAEPGVAEPGVTLHGIGELLALLYTRGASGGPLSGLRFDGSLVDATTLGAGLASLVLAAAAGSALMSALVVYRRRA